MGQIELCQLGPVWTVGKEGRIKSGRSDGVDTHSPNCLGVELGHSCQYLQGFSLECEGGCKTIHHG